MLYIKFFNTSTINILIYIGVCCSIELLQILVPFIIRSFDVDDIIFNTIGPIIGTYLVMYISQNNIKKIPSTLRQKGSSYSYFKLPAISVKITPSACAPASG